MAQDFQHLPESKYPRSYSKKFADKVRSVGQARRSDSFSDASPAERVLGDDINSGERSIKNRADDGKRAAEDKRELDTEKWNYREAQRNKYRRKKAGRTGRKRGSKRGRE